MDETNINKEVIEESDNDKRDPFLIDAIEEVIRSGQASTSYIQRKFIVGYSRALRIIEQMEELGIISEMQGSKPRIVKITSDEWNKMKSKFN